MRKYVNEDGTFEYGEYYFRSVETSGEEVYYCGLHIELCMNIVDIQRVNGNRSSTCEECVDIFFEMGKLYMRRFVG